ncbi:TRNA-uridine aminocarboxypropyltransferase [Aphelenchoides bicaudatus]|nr:TRNA-uridine aminocarboxypropyltransferase [Aphelenchoides bicaudatus]
MDERFKQLDALAERKKCPKCVSSLVPTVNLPFQIDIIKHSRELNSKSTAIHCALISPDNTQIFSQESPNVPDYSKELDETSTVLVFPDKSALPINEFVKQSAKPIKRLLFLDATWGDIAKLRRMKQLEKIPLVQLNAYKTEYWRPQKGYADECLATIEAIYYAIKEVWQAENPDKEYTGQFDDVLFWFQFFRSKYLEGYTKPK